MFLEARRHIKLTLLLAKRWLEIMDTLVTGKTYIFITGAAKSLITVLHKNENSIHVFDHKKQADRDIQMSVLNTGFCFEMVYAPSKVEIDVDSILDVFWSNPKELLRLQAIVQAIDRVILRRKRTIA